MTSLFKFWDKKPSQLLILIIALTSICISVQAQNNPTLSAPLASKYGLFYSASTNNAWPITLTNGETRVFNSTNKIAVQRDRGMAFFASFCPYTNATVTNITAKLDVSYDGTNWTTSSPITWAPMSGGTNTLAYTNIMRDSLDNYRYIRLTSLTAPTNTVISNFFWSVVP